MGAPFQWRLRGLYADIFDTHKGHSRHLVLPHCLPPTYPWPSRPFVGSCNRNGLLRGRQRPSRAPLAPTPLKAVPRSGGLWRPCIAGEFDRARVT